MPPLPMTADRWLRVKAITADALERPEGEQSSFLATACAGDETLRAEVESLLGAHARAGAFLEAPGLADPGAAGAVAMAAERAASPVAAGRRIGPYRILEELGHGGMGVVYLAERADAAFEKQVAIKVVRGGFAAEPLMQRFHEERRILATLDHPNIARLLDAGTTDDGLPYFVMEHVEGIPLDVYCERLPSLAPRLVLFHQVCAAVQYAHQRLVIHRDLKARNILVTADGTPKLLDFGIAKLLEPGLEPEEQTRTGLRVLTLEGASPEQVRGEPLTVTSDVYALGVLLYRLLAGQSPYGPARRTDADLMRAICEDTPERPSAVAPAERRRPLQGELDWITLKALRKEPDRRYGSVEQLADDIQRYLGGRPVAAAPDSWRYRARKFAARNRVPLAGGALLALSLAAGVTTTLWQARRAEEQRARAERRFNDVRKLANSFLFEFHDAVKDLPGSTPARRLVVAKALEYLDSLALEAGGDASLRREVATAYEKVGDVLGRWQAANLGEPRRALDAYRRAQAIREELAAADPGNSGIQRELATTYERIAELRFGLLGDPAGASEETGRMVRIEEALSTTDTAPAQSLRTGRSLARHGYFLGASGHTLESLETLRRAVITLEGLTAVGSVADEARQELARTFGFLAEVLEDGTPVTGVVPDLRAAVEMCRRRLALSQALEAAEPGSAARRRAVSFAQVGLGEILFKLGDRRAALEQYRQALEIARALSAADPADRQLLFTLSGIHQRIGTALALEGQAPAAIRNLEIALALLEPVIAADPTAATTRAYVADAYFGLGRAHAALGVKTALDRTARVAHWREARSWFQRSHAFWSELRQQGTTTGGSSARPEELSRKIGECDVALAKLTSPDGRP